METVKINEFGLGRIVRERPGKVRWRKLSTTDSVGQLLEQEWTIETYDSDRGVWGYTEKEWREVPFEDAN